MSKHIVIALPDGGWVEIPDNSTVPVAVVNDEALEALKRGATLDEVNPDTCVDMEMKIAWFESSNVKVSRKL